MWGAVIAGALGCWVLKIGGLSVPRRLLAAPGLARIALLLPIALLGTLVALQTFSSGQHLGVDARAAGLGVAVLAVLARAPFLVVVVVAVITTALVRLLH